SISDRFGSMRGDTRDEERRALQDAAYSRDATEGDRAALAAFDEERATSANVMRPKRAQPGWLALVGCAAVGALASAAVAAVIAQPWTADPFDRFTDTELFAPDLARVLAGAS
ncbi:hypothetical protein P2A57_24220, partial [Xanthomonas perforans]